MPADNLQIQDYQIEYETDEEELVRETEWIRVKKQKSKTQITSLIDTK